MKTRLYAIYDVKAAFYTAPYSIMTDQMAIRAFDNTINDPSNQMIYNHPEDFTLYFIGDYDDTSGEVIASPVQSLANGLQFKKDKS